ncbi:MAG: aryldialkylphosphatase [Proteobacteria bacterium]|nr:aryldialkylphosphatase [Pseudomonadota bacterium]
MRGKVHTVLGPIDPADLGATMMHEHILIHMKHIAKAPSEPSKRLAFYSPLTMETLGQIRFSGIANCENCELSDPATAIAELGHYAAAGGRTIVDATSIGIGRDPAGLAAIARATGLNIVMGCSYYVDETHPESHRVDAASEREIADRIAAELTHGVDGGGIRPGLIGEVGCSWPMTDAEIKVLRASARAQLETGAALMVHPGRSQEAPFRIVEILKDAGADLSRTIMCHIDRTLAEKDAIRRLAETGVIVEFDLFGYEGSYYAWELPIDMPNDAARINLLKWLIAEGFGGQITISHDICFRDKLIKHGGQGYSHILANVVPLMRKKGIRDEALNQMLVETPRRLLSFAER